MAKLSLIYQEDDAPNRLGDLSVVAEAEGFRGEGSTYVSADAVAAFGRRLLAYPLGSEDAEFSSAELRINAAALGSLGHLLITTQLRTYGRTVSQQATIAIETDYSAIHDFGKAIIAMANNPTGTALLNSDY
jgi:hypothetical protein